MECDFCDKEAKYFVSGYVAAVFEVGNEDDLKLVRVIYPCSHLDGEYYCEYCYNRNFSGVDFDDVRG